MGGLFAALSLFGKVILLWFLFDRLFWGSFILVSLGPRIGRVEEDAAVVEEEEGRMSVLALLLGGFMRFSYVVLIPL